MPKNNFVVGPMEPLASPPAGAAAQLKGGGTSSPNAPKLKIYEDQLPVAKEISIEPDLAAGKR